MLTNQKTWNKNHIGMIRYNNYWCEYSLVLDVDVEKLRITELDNFGSFSVGPLVRIHGTQLSEKDKFFTIAEYVQLLKDKKILSVDVNNKINQF